MKIKELAEKYQPYAVEIRREFHMHPEPSMKEYRTQKRVIEELEKMGLQPVKSGGTGVIATIEGKNAGKTIALRADMDALEIPQANDVPYKSKVEGMMHACGHDAHTASLLAAAKILIDKQDELNGNVRLLFQPGEEVAQGALALIEDGALDGVGGAFGIHIWNDGDLGEVSIEPGPRMASAGMFQIYVTGQGGHGSRPEQAVDAALVSAAILMNLQTLVSRETDPLKTAVVSVGKIESGTRMNVIAGDGYLEGTTRSFNPEIDEAFEDQIRRIAESTAAMYRAEARVEYTHMVNPTVNDPQMAEIGQEAVKKVFGEEGLGYREKTTGGEDFGFYSSECPTAFAFVGSKNEAKIPNYPHHHPKFDIDEEAMIVSASLYAQYAIDFLNQ